ncbi:hypothetical protein ACVW19_000764 [Streptomyces sp. TE5632]
MPSRVGGTLTSGLAYEEQEAALGLSRAPRGGA